MFIKDAYSISTNVCPYNAHMIPHGLICVCTLSYGSIRRVCYLWSVNRDSTKSYPVQIDPQLLFQRLTLATKTTDIIKDMFSVVIQQLSLIHRCYSETHISEH